MVKLSAVTVDEAAGHEISSSGGGGGSSVGVDGWHEEIVCGIPARRVKILLTNDMRKATGEDSHQEGANVDAWYDKAGDVFVLTDNGGDTCFLEAEEFEALERIEAVESDEDEFAAVAEDAVLGESATADSWEAEALAEIKAARLYVAEMEGRYLEAKERAKDCKQDWEAAVNRLTEVIDESTKPMPLFDQAATKAAEPTAEATSGDSDDWRSTPIDTLFSDVKGLGAKKQEAVRDAIPTLGAFEDLRARASLEGEPLKAMMPKGIGQDACDQLEEAALNWLSRLSKNAANGGDGGDAGEG